MSERCGQNNSAVEVHCAVGGYGLHISCGLQGTLSSGGNVLTYIEAVADEVRTGFGAGAAKSIGLVYLGTQTHCQQNGVCGEGEGLTGVYVLADNCIVGNLEQLVAKTYIKLQLVDEGHELRCNGSCGGLQVAVVILQLDNDNVLAFLLQVDGGFETDKTCADNYDLLAAGLLTCVDFGSPVNVILVDAGQLGNDGIAADSDDNAVIVFLFKHLAGSLGVQQDLCAAGLALMNEELNVVCNVLLEGGQSSVAHGAAKLTALFIESNVMTSVAEDLCSGDTAGATADNGDALLDVGLLYAAEGELALIAKEGVNCTADNLVSQTAAELAAQAGTVLSLATLSVLAGHFGVGQQRTAHGNEVCHAVGDDVLGALDAHNGADGVDEQVGELFLDGGCVVNVVLAVHHVVLPPVAHVFEFTVETCGNVENVDLILNHCYVLQGLVIAHAAGLDLICGDTELDNEVLAAQLTYAVKYLDGEAGAVFEASAVFVGTEVVEGAGELADKVAVSAVDHAHAHTCALCAVSSHGVLFYQLVDVLAGHLNGLERLAACGLGAHQFPSGIILGGSVSGATGAVKLRVLATVVNLERSVSAEALAHLGEPAQGQDALIGAHVQLQFFVAAFVDVDHNVADGEDSSAAVSDGAVQVNEFVSNLVVKAAQIERGGCQLNTVFEVNAANADRGKYVLVTRAHVHLPFCC